MESRCICQLWYFTRLQQLCTHCQVFLKLLQRFLCSPLLWKIDLTWFFYIRQSVEKTDTEAWAECFVELLKMQVIIHHKWRQGCAIGHRQWHALCVNLFRRNFWLSHRQAPPFFSLVITISKYFCGWCPIFIKQRDSWWILPDRWMRLSVLCVQVVKWNLGWALLFQGQHKRWRFSPLQQTPTS